MRNGILRMLVCPACHGTLRLREFKRSGKDEIIDGMLTCAKCRKMYPVINGIPRMLPSHMINSLLLEGFHKRYGEKIQKAGTVPEAGSEKVKQKTSKSFGFQWNVFSEMFPEYEKNFLNYIKPLKPGFFKGKLVLDAGCGFGRHTYYAAKYGAEVVGFDLSDAVEAAYKNCRKFPNAHIVQGDIYNPPFKKSFDFIMSIGVLHHLPLDRQEEGFLSLVKLMGKGTMIFAWLYGREGRWFKLNIVEGIIRRITTRMPHGMLYGFCYIPAAVYHSFNMIQRSLEGSSATKGMARLMPFKGYAKFPFRVKHADAFDLLATPVNNYYTREGVEKWAKDANLSDVEITDFDKRSWRLFGKR